MAAPAKSFVSLINPNPNPFINRGFFLSFSQLPPSSCRPIRFQALLRPHSRKIPMLSRTCSPEGLGTRLLSLDLLRSTIIVQFSASHEDSKSSDIDVEKKSEEEVGAEESEEAWKQMLESFKEQALKMQDMSQDVYEVYSKKAGVILKETTEKLKIQADQARHDLSRIAKEVSEESKEYLSAAAENSPEEVKDIVETFASSTDDLKDVSKVQDFYLGIPYGALLSLGGFLSFMVSGSVSAIRFGVILGGALLAMSISSLRSWKRGESSPLALKGQAVIAGIISLRHLRMLFQRPSFLSFFTTVISCGMVAFYIYRIMLDGDHKKGSSLKHGPES